METVVCYILAQHLERIFMKMEKVSLLIKNARVFNTYLKRFVPADVSVRKGKFYYIDRERSQDFQAEEVLDAEGMYMIPGFIDIHMHIESSMMTPGPFGSCLAGYGVTTIVSEPHEIANVKGMRGDTGNDLSGQGYAH